MGVTNGNGTMGRFWFNVDIIRVIIFWFLFTFLLLLYPVKYYRKRETIIFVRRFNTRSTRRKGIIGENLNVRDKIRDRSEEFNQL